MAAEGAGAAPGLSLCTLIAALLVGLSCGSDGERPVDAGIRCEGACDPYEIAWVGDILLGDAAQDALDEHGYNHPFAHLDDLLGADFLIGNQEGPITELEEPNFTGSVHSYNARPESAPALAEAGFDALGLSNNHILDRGPRGILDTFEHLRDAGIRPFGAGEGRDAAAPLLIETPRGSVAALGFGIPWRRGQVAETDRMGTVPYGAERIAEGERLADRAGARWVVAYVHWGDNYRRVTAEQRRAARRFADAGYDLVIGHHPHVAQPVGVVNGMPVLYSLGNFAFGTTGRFTARYPGYGLVARTTIGARGLRLELDCIVTDNDRVAFQSRPCPPDEARRLFDGLGPAVDRAGDVGVVQIGQIHRTFLFV